MAQRGLDFDVPLRHERDREILAEIFSRHCYKPLQPLVAPRVLDLGANIGLFSAYALKEFAAREIVAVEADPDNLSTLRQFVHTNELPIEVVGAFAGIQAGAVEFEAGLAANSRVAGPDSDSSATITVPVIDTFSLGSFDLAKIDIEGGEWALLSDERFPQLAPVVVMEWHTREQGAFDIDEALTAHGYTVQHVDRYLLWANLSP